MAKKRLKPVWTCTPCFSRLKAVTRQVRALCFNVFQPHTLTQAQTLPRRGDALQLLQLRIDITNPRQLRRDIYAALDQLFALPGAIPGHVENVFETLLKDQ